MATDDMQAVGSPMTVSESKPTGGEFFESQPATSRTRRPMRSTAMPARQSASRMKYCPVNQLKHIALDKNGTFMTDFDPEKSKREMRKLNRKIHKENKKQNQMYDEKGRLLENSQDVCDCLDKDCSGCHFPCPKCCSEKCGAECRCERRWIYEQIEVEGTNLVLKWGITKLP
ncbi:ARL14 effector protein-like isoform X2 [Babylonia areolata]|uniref:ARL14 effector protein-like isoform X2 n=1 Tax=Babylonia areolata TaxID=304850 RepID=UPI003FD0B828